MHKSLLFWQEVPSDLGVDQRLNGYERIFEHIQLSVFGSGSAGLGITADNTGLRVG